MKQKNGQKKLGISIIALIISMVFIIPSAALSAESQIEAFVTRLYQTTLDRSPDLSGLKYWTDGLSSGDLTGAKAAENFLLSEEMQLVNSWGLKINKRAFEELLTRAMTRREGTEGDDYFRPLTQEAADYLRNTVVSVEKMASGDSELINIILTESQGYFADQKSLEETTAVIQSRVMTLMNERA